MRIRFSQGARRHRIGYAHAWFLMATLDPTVVPATGEEERWAWTGPDDRGVELEVIAVALPDLLLVIHVMPTALRRSR